MEEMKIKVTRGDTWNVLDVKRFKRHRGNLWRMEDIDAKPGDSVTAVFKTEMRGRKKRGRIL